MDALNGVLALVVDGDRERCVLLSTILRYCGALATTADTSKAALAIIAIIKPDVVLVDLGAVDHETGMLIQEIRALSADGEPRVPVLAVGDGADPHAATIQGFDAYLARPLDARRVCDTIDQLLAR